MKNLSSITNKKDITTKEYVDKGLEDKLSFNQQNLTEDQKAQVRTNLSVPSVEDNNKKLNKSGGTMTGALDMGDNAINNIPDATANKQPVTYQQLKAAIAGLGTVFNLKGSVATYDELPKVDNKIGDVWFVVDESAGYIWIEVEGVEKWEPFGPAIDLSVYLEKAKLAKTPGTAEDNAMTQKATTDALNAKVSIEAQDLTPEQKAQVRKNIEASTYLIIREW